MLPIRTCRARRRDSLLLLAQSGLEVALATLPGLSKPSSALLAKVLLCMHGSRIKIFAPVRSCLPWAK